MERFTIGPPRFTGIAPGHAAARQLRPPTQLLTGIAACVMLAAAPALAQSTEPAATGDPQSSSERGGTIGNPSDHVVPPPRQDIPQLGRSAENAVRQAEDAFGFSVGRESLGLYSSSNVRGFSPLDAGNVRIEGLYYDPFLGLQARLKQSETIRIGLSAQGYPFPSPTGIVDYSFRKPGDDASLSMLASSDSYGTLSGEFDAVAPLSPELSLGFGAFLQRGSNAANTDLIWNHQAAALRWRPSSDIEVIPFWQRSEVRDNERSPIYIPAGDYLPPHIPRRRYSGPGWDDSDGIAALQGLLATALPWQDWTIRAGLFRSLIIDEATFAHLYEDLTPDGRANRLIIADPLNRFVSISGELRVSRAFAEGPRLHVVHLSYRGRDRRQRYGGSDFLDYGATQIGERFRPSEPDYSFTEQTRDKVRQSTLGLAYEGRWRNVGELSFGISRTDYHKAFELPGTSAVQTRSKPWLYNLTGAAFLGPRLTAYAGYARGLEESGIAPDNAANRNQPLPAILTRQIDGGLRFALTDKVKIVAGAFELRKPYYNLDAANRFDLLGEIVNRGIEFSVAGAVTPSLNIVAGGVLLRPRVTGEAVALGRVGKRPIGLPSRSFDFNADWQTPFLEGLSFDIGVSHVGAVPATRTNTVSIPARTLVDLGARYRFKLSGQSAALRIQMTNVGGFYGHELLGAGAYDLIPGRVMSAYLTVDF